jgi:hypothetical protein
MLGWWLSRGIDLVDIAVRRPCGAMLWHRQLSTQRLPLLWMRAENTRGAEVYIRPARDLPWPLVFLDDVNVGRAIAVARKYAALVVRTSPAGGCHIWLDCSDRLDERERALAQRWLAPRIDADLASTSGEHLGRLAGFRNWKRNGVWVNVLAAKTSGALPPWNPAPALRPLGNSAAPAQDGTGSTMAAALGRDATPSGRDWAWVCSLLEAGHDPGEVHRLLADRARHRRGRNADRYAARTIEQAARRLGAARATSGHRALITPPPAARR